MSQPGDKDVDVPPPPLPPRSHPKHGFLGHSPCNGWGREGGKGEFGIANDYPPPFDPLLSWKYFFAACEALRRSYTLIILSPSPLPRQCPASSCSSCQARGANSHPTTHHMLTLGNPRCSPHSHLLKVRTRGWGVGYNPSPQPHPPCPRIRARDEGLL